MVPKIPSYRIIDLVKAISPGARIKIVGIRPGEKIHEEMISQNDAQNTKTLNLSPGGSRDSRNLKSPINAPSKCQFLMSISFHGPYFENMQGRP